MSVLIAGILSQSGAASAVVSCLKRGARVAAEPRMAGLLTRARRIARGRLHALLERRAVAWEGWSEAPHAGRSAGSEGVRPPTPRTSDPLARARSILEVEPGADAAELRSAYRRLCRRYHPDRFAGDPPRERIANALLAEINDAYALLTREPPGRA
jgi:hypothetical protein